MLAKILGIFDLLTALALFLTALKVAIPMQLVVVLMIILLVKSAPFITSFCIASLIDIVVAVVLLVNLFFSVPVLILLIAALAIFQKGAMSFL